MGPDPARIVSYCEKHAIVVQAYSPLGNGELISDPQLSAIGSSITPAKSGVQVAFQYVVQSGHAVCTKVDNLAYLAEDIDVFS
jgi:diketogulonate reductase-like aldo/keto reductase